MHRILAPSAAKRAYLPESVESSTSLGLRPLKDHGIETLRGSAIILVVVGHVVHSLELSGLLSSASIVFQCHLALLHVRMPLFTAISGYVYALRPVVAGGQSTFITGKLRRLMAPFFVVSTIQYLVRSQVAAATHSAELGELWRIYVFRGDFQFWFLQSLLLVFLLIAWIDGGQRMKSPRSWILWVSGAALAMVFGPQSELFSFNGFLYLLPFFLFGCGVCRFEPTLSASKFALLAAVVFLVSMVVQQAGLWGYARVNLERRSVIGIAIGLSSTFLLFRYRIAVAPLAWLGKYAYSIFLFHILAAAGSRVLLRAAGVDDAATLLVVCTVAGLGAPIIVEHVAGRWGWSRLLLLGQRLRSKRGTEPAANAVLSPAPM